MDSKFGLSLLLTRPMSTVVMFTAHSHLARHALSSSVPSAIPPAIPLHFSRPHLRHKRPADCIHLSLCITMHLPLMYPSLSFFMSLKKKDEFGTHHHPSSKSLITAYPSRWLSSTALNFLKIPAQHFHVFLP